MGEGPVKPGYQFVFPDKKTAVVFFYHIIADESFVVVISIACAEGGVVGSVVTGCYMLFVLRKFWGSVIGIVMRSTCKSIAISS